VRPRDGERDVLAGCPSQPRIRAMLADARAEREAILRKFSELARE
jgi:hypothetical protein